MLILIFIGSKNLARAWVKCVEYEHSPILLRLVIICRQLKVIICRQSDKSRIFAGEGLKTREIGEKHIHTARERFTPLDKEREKAKCTAHLWPAHFSICTALYFSVAIKFHSNMTEKDCDVLSCVF